MERKKQNLSLFTVDKEAKLSLFTVDMTAYVENLKKRIDKKLELNQVM